MIANQRCGARECVLEFPRIFRTDRKKKSRAQALL
jgi:hypothetical protein